MECARAGCTLPQHTRGHCEKHYRYLLNTGRFAQFGRVDATEVRTHLLALREMRWTVVAIGEAAGVSMAHVAALCRGEYRTVRGDTARKILAVPLVASVSHHGVDPTGTMRRLQALTWMGWPAREIAPRLGVEVATVHTLACRGGGRGRVSSRLAQRVAEVFDDLSGVHGPDRAAAKHARRLGYAPPLAWDDDIDDPKARPRGVRKVAA